MQGSLFSVALSLGLPPPGVTRHRAFWSPDFPRHRCRSHPAIRAIAGLGPSSVHVNGEAFGEIRDHRQINSIKGTDLTGAKPQAEGLEQQVRIG